MADMYKQVDGVRVKMTPKEITEKKTLQEQWLKEQSKNNETIQEPYINQRRNDYPPIGDQLDMIWHTIDKDAELQHKFYDFYQTVKKTKVKFPKQ